MSNAKDYDWEWVSFLDKNYKDRYFYYKDNVMFQLENVLLNIENDLLKSNLGYDQETARKMAACLIMEQTIILQHTHAQTALKSMVISLFSEHPAIKNFRIDFYDKAYRNGMKKATFFSVLYYKLISLRYKIKKKKD